MLHITSKVKVKSLALIFFRDFKELVKKDW